MYKENITCVSFKLQKMNSGLLEQERNLLEDLQMARGPEKPGKGQSSSVGGACIPKALLPAPGCCLLGGGPVAGSGGFRWNCHHGHFWEPDVAPPLLLGSLPA